MTAPEPIAVIGVPVAGLDAIGAAGRAVIASATLLCGGARHLASVPAGAEERCVVGDVDACIERLRGRRPGERAVVLASGDPLLFGIGATLVRALGPEAVRIAPAASSVQEAFARARMSWSDARVVSAHGRPLGEAVAGIASSRLAAVLCGPASPPQAVAAALVEAGWSGSRCVVAERLGESRERVVDDTVDRIAASVFDPLSVVLVERREPVPAGASAGRRFGRAHESFSHAHGMVTRAEVRAVVLARLHRPDDAVLWDVGAGSGSIGIEAAALAPALVVHAVERDAEQLVHLRANATAFGCGRVRVVAGEAPAALAALPAPDAVVVGGHGGHLSEILDVVTARLRPGGRVVCSLATLEGVETARSALVRWQPEVIQIWVSRGVPAGRALRLRAEDPVTVVSAERPAGGAGVASVDPSAAGVRAVSGGIAALTPWASADAAADKPRPGVLYGIGVGPGDPGLVTVRAARLLAALDLVAVPRSARGCGVASHAIAPYVSKDRVLELVSDMPVDAAATRQGWRDRVAPLVDALSAGRAVGFATDGDPSLFSTFTYAAAAARAALPALEVAVVAGVPAMCAAAAVTAQALAEGAQRLAVLPASRVDDAQLVAALEVADTVVLLKVGNAIERLRRLLDGAARGWTVQYSRRLGLPGEQTTTMLEGLDEPGDYMALVVLRRPREAAP